MQLKYIFWVLVLLLCACARPGSNRTDFEMLDDSTLMLVMTDAYILNAAFAQTFGVVKDSISQAYARQIEEKYNISQEALEANIDFLYNDPARLDTFYDLLLQRIDYLDDNARDLNVKPDKDNQ